MTHNNTVVVIKIRQTNQQQSYIMQKYAYVHDIQVYVKYISNNTQKDLIALILDSQVAFNSWVHFMNFHYSSASDRHVRLCLYSDQ